MQSGSDRILALMNRSYTVAEYRARVEQIRRTIPDVSLSTDIIAGFPTESEQDHAATLGLLDELRFDGAFTFKYSPREKTKAWSMEDAVPDATKIHRLNQIIEKQRSITAALNAKFVGETVEVLVEGPSAKSPEDLCGRTDSNRMVVFSRCDVQPGQYVLVEILAANAATLFGKIRSGSERQTMMTHAWNSGELA